MDVLNKEQRHNNMSHICSRDTKPEAALRKSLWHRGLRCRKNYKALPGTPDIALTKYKIAVFVDGDFWHARGHWEHPGERVRTNPAYWQKKLANNVARDRAADEALTELGWLVLRFWPARCRRICCAAWGRYADIAEWAVKTGWFLRRREICNLYF